VPHARDGCRLEEQVVDRLTVERALEELSGAERRLVELRYLHDWPNTRIAEATGLTSGAVRVRIHRARARMCAVARET